MYSSRHRTSKQLFSFPSIHFPSFMNLIFYSSSPRFHNPDASSNSQIPIYTSSTTLFHESHFVSSNKLIESPPCYGSKEPMFRNKFNQFNQHSFSNGVVSLNKKMTDLIRAGDLNSALKVFNDMPVRTRITWNSLLAGFSRKPGKLVEAQELFDKIPERDTVSYNTMLSCYLKNDDMKSAVCFFERMPCRDIASWNTMITGFLQNGKMIDAKRMFLAMPDKNVRTWNAMISGYAEFGDTESALELFKLNPVKDVVSWTVIVTGFMRSGKVDLAETVFKDMPEKSLVTWNSMISGYVENGRGEDGLKLFKSMLELRVPVNESSLSSVLLGCSNLSSLKLGKQVHQNVLKVPLYLNATVGTSLISMYSKCGDLEDAWKLFLEMPHKDLVTWNAMISGYAQHGAGEKSLSLFDVMRSKGFKPDSITFIGVLSACNHAGLVDLGIQYFEEMQKDYKIKPQPDHYTCMVDLLGRAGKLAKAVDLIKKMSVKPHLALFGILLGACKIYKNVEVAEFAAENLLKLDPSNPVAYVQLANVYAANNRWENVSKIRRLMKENNVIKTPGFTWLEVKGIVHEFRSGDRVHPDLKDIHKKLNELQKKMKLAGYVSNLESDLHDVGDEQKEQLLLWHSEKLAIGFGLITLPSGTPIRIFKNLRICDDCHHATKFISAIEGREIIVRDTTRFHHFKDGICSCGDYW